MSEIVERVAEAIAAVEIPADTPVPIYEWYARAAIEAMREPMLETVRARATLYETIASSRDPIAPDDTNPHGRSAFGAEVVECVERDLGAMIDAALAPTP